MCRWRCGCVRVLTVLSCPPTALFLLDNRMEVYLWQRGPLVAADSACSRWANERRCAMQTTLQYCKGDLKWTLSLSLSLSLALFLCLCLCLCLSLSLLTLASALTYNSLILSYLLLIFSDYEWSILMFWLEYDLLILYVLPLLFIVSLCFLFLFVFSPNATLLFLYIWQYFC